MAKKANEKIQDQELEKVSGGAAVVTEAVAFDTNDKCPKCKSENVTSETTGSGCDKKTTYKCNDCGHTW